MVGGPLFSALLPMLPVRPWAAQEFGERTKMGYKRRAMYDGLSRIDF